MRRCKTRDRHAERRAGDVVQSGIVAELDRARFAAVLAADAALEFGLYAAALEYGLAHELTHAVLIEYLERVVFQDALFEIDGQELGTLLPSPPQE